MVLADHGEVNCISQDAALWHGCQTCFCTWQDITQELAYQVTRDMPVMEYPVKCRSNFSILQIMHLVAKSILFVLWS